MSTATVPTATTTGLVTAEDLWEMPAHGGNHELVKGELIDMPPAGFEHGSVGSEIALVLGQYVRQQRLGRTFAAETGFIIERDPDTVRAADVAFIAKERLPAERTEKFSDIVPDLVAEVVSPHDTAKELEEKITDWLNAGVRVVWVLYPRTQTIHVHRSGSASRRLTAAETLDGEDVVPGFSCPVAELFA